MSDLEKIILTSGLTIFGGVLVFIVGQIINEFVTKPFFRYREIVSKIANDLEYYSHIMCNPGQENKDHPLANEASFELRRGACDLRSIYRLVRWNGYFIEKKILMNEENKEVVASNLIGLSNGLWDASHVDYNLKSRDKIFNSLENK